MTERIVCAVLTDAVVMSWLRRQFSSGCRHMSACVEVLISVHHVMLSSLRCAKLLCHLTMHCTCWLSVQTLEVCRVFFLTVVKIM